MPGKYEITYTWGDEVKNVTKPASEVGGYSVQKYKATVYKEKDREANNRWYAYKEDTRYSDAKDDLNIRKQIDEEMTTNKASTATEDTTIHRMNSTTPQMEIPVEYNTIETDSKADRLEYAVKNVDFGIVERPRQEINFEKVISNIKVTYANGQVLCDGDPNKESLPGVQVLPDKSIRIEIGNELLYGSQLEITYELVATNTSEIDYSLIANNSGEAEANFYNYGKKPTDETNLVQYDNMVLLDYVDNELTFKTGTFNENEYTWKEMPREEILKLVEKGYMLDEQEKQDLLQTYSTVLETEGIKEGTIKPIEGQNQVRVPIVLTRLLANGEELAYDNTGNVVQVGKNGGGPITSELRLQAKAPTVTITPATGQSRIYYVIGIGALVVLSGGIILIRKKVLKK